jgi:GxxExxY protein
MTRIDLPRQPLRDTETYAIIGSAMQVHRVLGPGFLEPVYRAALEVELEKRGVPWASELVLPVYYEGVQLRVRYRPDFVCFGSIVVEIKALSRIGTPEQAQIINYLKASRLQRGLLLNFGARSLEYKRFLGHSVSSV